PARSRHTRRIDNDASGARPRGGRQPSRPEARVVRADSATLRPSRDETVFLCTGCDADGTILTVRLDLSLLRRPELGSVFLGREHESLRRRSVRLHLILIPTLLAPNLVGVTVAAVLILFVLPGPSLLSSEFLVPTHIVVPVYV